MHTTPRNILGPLAGALLLLAFLATATLHCSSSRTRIPVATSPGSGRFPAVAARFDARSTRAGCALTIGCTVVSYTGTISGDTVGFQSFAKDGGVAQSCQGTLAGGTMLSGSCTASASSCSFTATKH